MPPIVTEVLIQWRKVRSLAERGRAGGKENSGAVVGRWEEEGFHRGRRRNRPVKGPRERRCGGTVDRKSAASWKMPSRGLPKNALASVRLNAISPDMT